LGIFWSHENIAKYEKATEFLNYPEVPLKDYFQEMIRPEDTVLEIGSGVGIVSLYLAPLCKKLLAVEDDKNGCDNLRKRAAERGLTNIEVLHCEWPNDQIKQADVSITLYVCKIFNSVERVRELLKSTRRAGIIMIPQSGIQGEYAKRLRQHLGIRSESKSCYNDGCRTVGLLEAAGAKVNCEKIHHEFGQPVNNLDEAVTFMMRKLKLAESYLPEVQAVAEEYTEIRNGRLYVPFERMNCLITFEK
jgi:SAM-dependent methyltransferase